jgi:ectoine hydroxylase
LICCYNAKLNDPYKDSHHPRYTKLEKVDDAKVLEIGHDDAERSKVAFANLVAVDASAKSLAGAKA